MMLVKPTGTNPGKVKRLVPGTDHRTHLREYPVDELDRRTLLGDRRTRFQQRKDFKI